jgi:hypothetical protein
VGSATSGRRLELTKTGGSVGSVGSAALRRTDGSKSKVRTRKQTFMPISFSRERGVVGAERTGLLARASNLLAAPSHPINFGFSIFDFGLKSKFVEPKIQNRWGSGCYVRLS